MKRKLNWNNLAVLFVFTLSIIFIIYDLTILTIATFIGKMAGWTWLGFITFIANCVLLTWSYETIEEILHKKQN